MHKAISGPPALSQLRDTRDAFDSVAADYDGPRGNNALIQDMRQEMWSALDSTFGSPSRLIDLGCGTGLDAVRLARLGHEVTATDFSPAMVRRTLDRAVREGLGQRVHTLELGAHELERLGGESAYDGAYSNLGPLNCVPDLEPVARECARLLRPGGALVFTVIGRICPWEIAYYACRGRWARAAVRFARGSVAVSMNSRTIWTRYYRPGEFYAAFAPYFSLERLRGLAVLAPPPYLTSIPRRWPRGYGALRRIERRVAAWPLIRGAGDHFMMVLRKR